ncbi:S1 family peptidase [Pseudooceanicola atlanticus]|uniref:S1 family peptidase n=1 Tax=Pseudooceanicola atlanticus TaxID=1461694 RepID=UPI0023558749|nr:serine protease [Pseudooceanicola atlanticus]
MTEENKDQGLTAGRTEGFAGLPYCVIRIISGNSDPTKTNVGTGFYYTSSAGTEKGQFVPLIVTNKHVLKGATWCVIEIAKRNPDGSRHFGPAYRYKFDINSVTIFDHPDPGVDVTAIACAPLLEDFKAKSGLDPYMLSIDSSIAPPGALSPFLTAGTSVLMIGFPNGLADEQNNMPVMRRGILAAPYTINFQGRTDFVVDIAAFGGSSGSPVFAYFDGMVPILDGPEGVAGMGIQIGGPSIYFLGLLHSGPQVTADGDILVQPAPTSKAISRTNIMMHIGFCAKASTLDDIESLVAARL